MLAIQSKPGMPNTSGWPSLGGRPNNMGNGSDIRSLLLTLLNGMGGGMFKGFGSSLLGIGSSMFTNWMNQQWAQQQQQAQWAQEQKFADQAYRRQLNIIEKYETPKAIKNMLKEAGLSPGLMYSKGGAGTVGTGNTLKGIAGMGNIPMMTNPLSMMGETLQLSKLKAELDNIKADTEKKEAETGYTTESTENLEIMNENLQKQIDEELENLQSETDKNKASEILLQTQNYAQELQNMFKETTFWTEVEGKYQETENAKKLGEKIAAEMDKIYTEISNLNVDTKLKNALTRKAISEMLLANEHILTESFERSFAKMMTPIQFNTARANLKQALADAYSKELDNIQKEILTKPGIVKFNYWNDVAYQWVSTGLGVYSAALIGKGMNQGKSVIYNKSKRKTLAQAMDEYYKNTAIDIKPKQGLDIKHPYNYYYKRNYKKKGPASNDKSNYDFFK